MPRRYGYEEREDEEGGPPKREPVKLTQPIQIDWALAKTLVKAKAMRPPTVPKMEAMEKWILGRGWELSIEHDKAQGLTVATIMAPGDTEVTEYRGLDATMAMATAKAIGAAFNAQPQQSSFLDGQDDPGAKEPAAQTQTALEETPEPTEAATVSEEPTPGPPPLSASGWRMLFQVDVNDIALWKELTPRDEQEQALVQWCEGDDVNDRGFYLAQGLDYEPREGWIRRIDDEALLWSRPVAEKVTRTKKRLKASQVDFAQAEALQKAADVADQTFIR